ncbi:transglycosylase domain-containing protein [Sphingobacterium bovistauri]|uniref:Transglycosylase domain-containing protein n=1 Tax=Sphingobacterium bovistauri TaxID=2781959 RepID=A0ABS7Z313_9SPHI|nr:transglycosylase domain-containing protein [Sphingobacterium bovistauri]MCA5004353.1 transglycosylase domain-containing protein [Sphingobacterium bovistauri]
MRNFFTVRRRKWLVIIGASLLIIIGIGFAVGMSKRQGYLDRAIASVKNKLKRDSDVNFSVDKCYFKGLTTIEFENLLVVPEGRDTLASMDRLSVSVRLFPLLFGDVEVGDIGVTNGALSFVKSDSSSNYDFLFKKKKSNSPEPNTSSKGFADLAERLSNQFFALVPDDLDLTNFAVSYKDEKIAQRIHIPEAKMRSGDFKSSVLLNDHEAEWVLEGEVNRANKRMRIEVSSKDKDVELPFLRSKYGLSVSFDKLIFDLKDVKKIKKELLEVDGVFAYENLQINHRRLSDSTIVLTQAEMHGGIQIADNYFALKDNSTIRVKDFSISPNIKCTLKPSKRIDLAIHTGMFQAQDFFDALPKGLFQNVEGVKVEGSIAYDLDFSIDLDNPDDLVFASKIDDEDLKVISWGGANIDSLNTSFVYDAYNDTILAKQFVVGPENPNFRRLDQIPYVLKTTVRNTEDPFFYQHNGFEEEAFKLSIATNVKEKKFKRGASTISMQLVKNVFLNRKKTMNRKFEEILLVWLMEASGRVSKDRLFEIYLNVIEWGRNVYGITEAAEYYFKKKPEELNLGESLFLSSIIPRPKTGITSFEHTGHLKGWVQRHFNTYGSIMNKMGELKEVSVPENYGFYQVVLQPSLRPKAPIARDSTFDIFGEHELIIQEIEAEEKARKSILDKLIGGKDENN